MHFFQLLYLYTCSLKYFILKVDPKKRILFDPKASVDFQGNTGPFIQYTYARIQSILRKAKFDFSLEVKSISTSLHSKEKDDLLGLTYLGACKISRNIMEMKAIERGYTDKLREEMTRSNWENCDATIFDSYEDINRFVVETCKLYDIDI